MNKTPNAADWPYNLGSRGDVTETAYKSWLEKCQDSDKQEYYLAKDEKTGLRKEQGQEQSRY